MRGCCDCAVVPWGSCSGCVRDHGFVYEEEVVGWIGPEELVEASEKSEPLWPREPVEVPALHDWSLQVGQLGSS